MWRISTPALTEGDGCIDRRRKVHEISTHALTEGDHLDVPWRPSDIISTHALTEGDELCDPMTAALGNFNSRPHGGRLIWICLLNYSFVFQLTPSRRATVSPGIAVCKFLFQLTPSRRATSLYFWIASSSGLFQLTPSRRATEQINCNFFLHLISTHALTEGDYSPDMLVVSAGLFQLTPSRRATSVGNISATEVLVFQLTPSRRATTGLMPQKRHTAFQLTPSRRATISHL